MKALKIFLIFIILNFAGCNKDKKRIQEYLQECDYGNVDKCISGYFYYLQRRDTSYEKIYEKITKLDFIPYLTNNCKIMKKPESCALLALLIEFEVDEKDNRIAIYYQKACELDNILGCRAFLAAFYASSKVDQDNLLKDAFYKFKIECSKGELLGCIFQEKLNLEEKKEKSKKKSPSSEKEENFEEKYSCDTAKECLEIAFKSDELEERIFYLDKACELNDGHACAIIGEIYHKEELTKHNVELTRYYLEKACFELSNLRGCSSLVDMYRSNCKKAKKREINCTELISIYEELCEEKQIGEMCRNYADLIEPLDLEKALYLYKKACSFGDAGGCYDAGRIYLNNLDDSHNAITFFTEACKISDFFCSTLEYLYRKGVGDDDDYIQARELDHYVLIVDEDGNTRKINYFEQERELNNVKCIILEYSHYRCFNTSQ